MVLAFLITLSSYDKSCITVTWEYYKISVSTYWTHKLKISNNTFIDLIDSNTAGYSD